MSGQDQHDTTTPQRPTVESLSAVLDAVDTALANPRRTRL